MADHDEDCSCFACKCAYWREHGSPGVIYGGAPGRRADFFALDSVAERERRQVEELKAKGVSFERA